MRKDSVFNLEWHKNNRFRLNLNKMKTLFGDGNNHLITNDISHYRMTGKLKRQPSCLLQRLRPAPKGAKTFS